MRGGIFKIITEVFGLYLFLGFSIAGFTQQTEQTPLFLDNEVLEARLEFNFRDLKRSKSDSIYHDTKFYYKTTGEEWDSIDVRIRGRGNFRRDNCFFLPIKMKIKKKDREGTLFEGNKNLKLVMSCHRDKSSDDLVIKEYLCYQLYESISPYAFSTRLMNLSLTDNRNRKTKEYRLKAFIIEDDKQVARRADCKVLEGFQRNALFMQDSLAALQDVFQYMIGNTDWSSDMQHNIKIMQLPSKIKIPVPFDFDMSGLVNAPYAVVNEKIPIKNVRERHFRGLCRNEELGEYVRLKYIELEPALWETVQRLEGQLDPKEALEVRDYLEEFFDMLKNKKDFDENIVQNCRKLE